MEGLEELTQQDPGSENAPSQPVFWGRVRRARSESVNPAFWKGRRVLITGHTGFKGAWLSLWLQSAGARVAGYALDPPTSPNLFDLAKVGQGMESVIADIRDVERLAGTMK